MPCVLAGSPCFGCSRFPECRQRRRSRAGTSFEPFLITEWHRPDDHLSNRRVRATAPLHCLRDLRQKLSSENRSLWGSRPSYKKQCPTRARDPSCLDSSQTVAAIPRSPRQSCLARSADGRELRSKRQSAKRKRRTALGLVAERLRSTGDGS